MPLRNCLASGLPLDLLLSTSVRTLQFVLAVAAIGIFASDLHAADPATDHIYALVAAALSALTAAFGLVSGVTHGAWYFWDFVLCVLWAALAGTVGTHFLGDGVGGQRVIGVRRDRMAAGMGVALASMVLWLMAVVHGCVLHCATRRNVTFKATSDPETARCGRETLEIGDDWSKVESEQKHLKELKE